MGRSRVPSVVKAVGVYNEAVEMRRSQRLVVEEPNIAPQLGGLAILARPPSISQYGQNAISPFNKA